MNGELLWDGIDRITDPAIEWDPKRWTHDLAGNILQAQGWEILAVPCLHDDCGKEECKGEWALAKDGQALEGEEILHAAIESLDPNPVEVIALAYALRATDVTLPNLIGFARDWAAEGAARRASGQPQYDQDRFALAAPAALRDCE